MKENLKEWMKLNDKERLAIYIDEVNKFDRDTKIMKIATVILVMMVIGLVLLTM